MEAPKSPMRRVRGYAMGTLAALILLPSLLLGNLAQMVSCLLLPFSRKAFRTVNRFIADTWWSWCVLLGPRLCGTRVEISGDEFPEDEDAIVLCNHQSMSDITVLFELAHRKGRLGDLKWYVKDILKYVPGIGWGMLFLDCLFVKRNWTADKDSIRSTFHRIVRDRVPVWVVSFAEGTRITKSKRRRSRDYAAAHGQPVLDHLLLPRTKGFVATTEGLCGHFSAVYDVTIGYHKGIPTLMQWFFGYVDRVSLFVRRHAAKSLPADDGERAQWLFERYVEKDRMLDEFYRTGVFPS